MLSPGSLSYLLLLPLGTCFPLLAREGPVGATGHVGGEVSWAGWPRGSSQGHRAPPPPAPLVLGEELQAAGRGRAGLRLRVGRQDPGGSEAAGFLPAEGEKAGGPLGTLAEELTSYSRKKGGFSFRFGRR
ncbi:PREDICTED: orexigenic neuropeptide QRFP [Condylura cristata]|uniref:orexigenic neuropeptide QRFP n=1 Tax=Condylura cristata TaxID=143302 RepID=UPI0003345286|nr:PREDICTED: orexigenic neuropeptide QRFP [Condylura cristata]